MKAKILGISNEEDSIWFKLSPTKESLDKLDLVLSLYSYFPFQEVDVIPRTLSRFSYSNLLKKGYDSFFIDKKDFVAYVILTKTKIHFILRKLKKFETKADELVEQFK